MGSSSTERMRALRARRAASLLPADGQAARDTNELLLPSVDEALATLDLDPEHAAARKLAQRYPGAGAGSSPARYQLRRAAGTLSFPASPVSPAPSKYVAVSSGIRRLPAADQGFASFL